VVVVVAASTQKRMGREGERGIAKRFAPSEARATPRTWSIA
jgi:hypothetical protein